MLKSIQNKYDMSNHWSEWYKSMVQISGGREFVCPVHVIERANVCARVNTCTSIGCILRIGDCSRLDCWRWWTRSAGSQRPLTKHWSTSCCLSTRHMPSSRSQPISATKHTSAWSTTLARWTTVAISGCSRTWIRSMRTWCHCCRSRLLISWKPSGEMVSEMCRANDVFWRTWLMWMGNDVHVFCFLRPGQTLFVIYIKGPIVPWYKGYLISEVLC